MNIVTLIGRLGNNPEIKNTDTTKIASFSLATSKRWKDREGNKQEKTTWHNIVIFGKLADIVESYVKKGDQVCVVGEINTDTYEKDGEKRYSIKIIANQLEMLGSKDDSSPVNPQKQAETDVLDGGDNKLPF